MTLGTFEEGLEKQGKNASFIGSMMFSRGISGARCVETLRASSRPPDCDSRSFFLSGSVVVPTTENTICGFTFQVLPRSLPAQRGWEEERGGGGGGKPSLRW